MRRTYGMTEHASQIATEKGERSGLEPLPGVELGFSEEGEILVRSQCLASGILRNGEVEPLSLVDGFFPTGDLGCWSGNRLLVNGRKSELIISGGKKIYPQAIEQTLAGMEALADAAITSIPDAEWGEAVCALLVKNPRAAIAEQEVKDFLSTRVERFEMPKHWAFVDRIPRAPAGKILRPELRALAASLIPSRN